MRRGLNNVLRSLFNLKEIPLDKFMRKEVTKPIKKAETILKKAEKNNMRLANYDEKVRDPIIDKAVKASGKKIPNPPKGTK